MSTLKTFLAENGIRQEDFAKRLKVNQATISRLTQNKMRPSLPLAVAIERETGGVVLASAWITDDSRPAQ